jgi:pimeloyl-ACP methyl ester carboxylesterase
MNENRTGRTTMYSTRILLGTAFVACSVIAAGCTIDSGEPDGVDDADATSEEALTSTPHDQSLSDQRASAHALPEQAFLDTALPTPPPEAEAVLTQNFVSTAELDKIRHMEHRVHVGNGRIIAMTETYTLRSWLRFPHRAILMIPAQGSNRSTYNAPFDGFDGGAIMAADGFFASSADPQGTGDSSQPASGSSVTYQSETADFLRAIDYIRLVRLVGRVDAFGEEIGGGVAMQLAADPSRVRSCVAASMIYKTGSDFFNFVFNSPEFQAALFSAPDKYFETSAPIYFNVLLGATPELTAWFLSTQVGRYASGTYQQDFDRLFSGGTYYDPTNAAVPGLLIRGEADPNNAIEDVQALANAYGSHHPGANGPGPAAIAVIPGGNHIVRLDAAPRGPQVWDLVKGFVDGP